MRFLAAAGALALVLAGLHAAGPQKEYIHEDAVLAGQELYSFEAGGETTTVILGNFKLTLGPRTLSGRDAVLWIKEQRLGQQTLREIEIYIEGNAKAVEPNGATTTDRVMFVTVRQEGPLRARVGAAGTEKLADLPVYRAALEMRRQRQLAATAPAAGPPVAIVSERALAATRPQRPRPFEPVEFHAASVVGKQIPDPTGQAPFLRVAVLTGEVVLTQGNPRSSQFLTLQANAAVVYALPTAASGPAAGPAEEGSNLLGRVLGAYLEGDVRMSLGERTVTGKQLYYDFRTGKALILEPLLRMVQEQRNVPLYIRAKEGRQLQAQTAPSGTAARGSEWVFTDAEVTSSDFYSPDYAIASKRVYIKDTTPYVGETAVGPGSWHTELSDNTFSLYGLPVLWSPYYEGDAEQGHTALRRVSVMRSGRFGWGGETDWFLFRLLGIAPPPGFKGTLEADMYERGLLVGPKITYERPTYAGHLLGTYMDDLKGEDRFGTERKDIPAPSNRGRAEWWHKQFLPNDWELQVEAAWLSDKNFLEEFYPGEFFTGKEKENLLYAKKQQDNWAVTFLAQARVNDFLTQTESLPELAGYLQGQPLANDLLSWYSEAHLGAVRYRPADKGNATAGQESDLPNSDTTLRADLRQEVQMPLAAGPVKIVPFVVGRGDYWSDSINGDSRARAWGEVGVMSTLHVWRVYDDVHSRLWDLNRLKHVITPYVGLFAADSNVGPEELYPFTPGIEDMPRRLAGEVLGVRQLWQTKRGAPGQEKTVDWMRLDVYGAFFDDNRPGLPADGRYFWSRPEYSLPRDAVNADYTWNISDSTAFLGYLNYDVRTGGIGRGDAGFAVSRDPRLKYYLGVRYIRDLDSLVGTAGFNYQINRKYYVSVFEQYDFKFDSGSNLATSVSLVRKFPRWYLGVTAIWDKTQGDMTLGLTFWPEGVPELRLGGNRLSALSGFSEPED